MGPTESVVIENLTLKIDDTQSFFFKDKERKEADRPKTVVIANLTLYRVTLYGVSTVFRKENWVCLPVCELYH